MDPALWREPVRFFLDSSVLFSAAVSHTGASRALFALAELGLVRLPACSYVLEEVERSLHWKNPMALTPLRLLIQRSGLEILPDATREEIEPWLSVSPDPDDAPILAAAVRAHPARLITLDEKHLIAPPQAAARTGLIFRTPGQVMQEIRQYLDVGFERGVSGA